MTVKGEVLMLVHRIPYPPDKGDKIRSFNELKYLSEQGWRVHLCALADDPADMQHLKTLKKYCASVAVEPLKPTLRKIASLIAPFYGMPMSSRYFYNGSLQARVNEVLHCRPITAVLCFCGPMAEYVRRSPAAARPAGSDCEIRYVMDLVDVDSDKWEQYAERAAAPMKWLYRLEGCLLHRYEQRIAENFHATALVSDVEAELFRRRTSMHSICAVGNGVDLDYFHARPRKKEGTVRRIAFCGAMSYLPNVDAVCWFAKEVLPTVREVLGEVEFCIIGGGVGKDVHALEALPGVRVTGRVDDVRPYVWNADLSVAPIRIARGIQNKVLEAMAMEVAVLATPQAFEGLEAEAGRDVVVAPDEPEAFAAAVIHLLRDRGRRLAVAFCGRKVVEMKYSWEGRLQVLEELLNPPAAMKQGEP